MSDKPYVDQTREERIACLDRIQNVLVHADFAELKKRWSADAADLQRQMDNAPDWETFVAARAVKLYVSEALLKLRDNVAAEKADLEEAAAEEAPLPPTDYELE